MNKVLVTLLILLAVPTLLLMPKAASQGYLTTTNLITAASTETVQTVVSYANTSEFVGGPNVIDGCPWIEVQTMPGQIVKIDFVAQEGTTVDFYIVRFSDYYPFSSNCRPIPSNPLVAEKGIQSYSQNWTPPNPGKFYLLWRNATIISPAEQGTVMLTCTDCGFDITVNYSIISSTTGVTAVTLTSLILQPLQTTTVQPPQPTAIQSTSNTPQLLVLAVLAVAVVGAIFLYSRRKGHGSVT